MCDFFNKCLLFCYFLEVWTLNANHQFSLYYYDFMKSQYEFLTFIFIYTTGYFIMIVKAPFQLVSSELLKQTKKQNNDVKNTFQKGADWFCVMVGYANGSVGFYTNDGHLLLMEKFDDKPVLKISCHTGMYGTLPDDVYILYASSECIVAGPALFKTLRRAKTQLARGKP